MTSFTKALYRRDPKAAQAFHDAQQWEHRVVHGRTPTLACFTPSFHGLQPVFGKRTSTPHIGGRQAACSAICGHPACAQGCTLQGGKISG